MCAAGPALASRPALPDPYASRLPLPHAARCSIDTFVVQQLPWDWAFLQDYLRFFITGVTILVSPCVLCALKRLLSSRADGLRGGLARRRITGALPARPPAPLLLPRPQVVAVPEGLPLAVTLALAFSVRRMLADHNLVSAAGRAWLGETGEDNRRQ